MSRGCGGIRKLGALRSKFISGKFFKTSKDRERTPIRVALLIAGARIERVHEDHYAAASSTTMRFLLSFLRQAINLRSAQPPGLIIVAWIIIDVSYPSWSYDYDRPSLGNGSQPFSLSTDPGNLSRN